MRRARSANVTTTTVKEETAHAPSAPSRAADAIDSLLEKVEQPVPSEAPAAHAIQPAAAIAGASLRAARIVSLEGRTAKIAWRGKTETVTAELAPELDPELVANALEQRDAVLVETEKGTPPLVVGVLQTRVPREIKLKAGTITIEGDQEVLIRSGRAALRLREDGDIEIVGSRISAASRGLFRLVGRILRLN